MTVFASGAAGGELVPEFAIYLQAGAEGVERLTRQGAKPADLRAYDAEWLGGDRDEFLSRTVCIDPGWPTRRAITTKRATLEGPSLGPRAVYLGQISGLSCLEGGVINLANGEFFDRSEADHGIRPFSAARLYELFRRPRPRESLMTRMEVRFVAPGTSLSAVIASERL